MTAAHPFSFWSGVACALSAAALISVMNVCAKLLSAQLDPVMVTFWRNAGALALLTAYFILSGKTSLMRTARPGGQAIRAVIGTAGMVFSVWAYSLLPLTEATILGFTSPLFVILLSYPLLREKVGIYRGMATLAGFAGILIIVNPGGALYLPLEGVLVAVAWAFLNAIVLICLRWLGKTEHALTTVFYFLAIGLVLCGLYAPFADRVIPEGTAFIMLVIMIGAIGLLSLLFKTEAYRHAPASLLAPFGYTILLWSVLFDMMIWGNMPPLQTWVGAAVIIGANGIILWREYRISKHRLKTDSPLPE